MPRDSLDIDAGNLFSRLTVTLRVPLLTRLRWRVGMWVMRLGVLISGFGVEVIESDGDERENGG